MCQEEAHCSGSSNLEPRLASPPNSFLLCKEHARLLLCELLRNVGNLNALVPESGERGLQCKVTLEELLSLACPTSCDGWHDLLLRSFNLTVQ